MKVQFFLVFEQFFPLLELALLLVDDVLHLFVLAEVADRIDTSVPGADRVHNGDARVLPSIALLTDHLAYGAGNTDGTWTFVSMHSLLGSRLDGCN